MGLETWASIYPSQVIEIHFFVKNSFFFFHQISKFWAVLPYELQKNLAFNDQYSLFWPILLKFMVLHIRVTLLNKKNMKLCSPIFTSENYDFFLKLFTKENCRNPILPKFKAYNFSIIMIKGIKMA